MSNRWLRKKNVVGYGLGIKRVKGEKTGEEAMLFFVEKKTDDIADEDRVPDIIDGKKTDVIEFGKVTTKLLEPCGTDLMQKTIVPIRGGLQLSTGVHLGTLGAVVKDNLTGKLFAITNSHVAGDPVNCTQDQADYLDSIDKSFIHGPSSAGLEMYQSTTDDNQFGEVVRNQEVNFDSFNRVDTALISIKSEFGVTPGIMGLSKYAQPFIHPGTIPVGTAVLKSGRTTGVTYGEILSMDATLNVGGRGNLNMPFENQIIVYSDNTETLFMGSGDSGAVLCVDLGDERVGIIGHLHAGTEMLEIGGSWGVASRLDDIVDALDIRPWRGEIITGSDHPDVVSTGFGAVYEKDTVTFLTRTNDYVCDGMICGLTPLTVRSNVHPLISYASYDGAAKLTLQLGYPIVYAQVDTDVGIEINCTVTSGAVLDAGIGIQIGLEADVGIALATITDANVGIRIIAEGDIVVGTGIHPEVNADIFLSVDLETDVSQALPVTVDTDCIIMMSLDVGATVYDVVPAVANVNIKLSIELEAGMNVTGLDYGGGDNSVSICSGENVDDLFYGVSL